MFSLFTAKFDNVARAMSHNVLSRNDLNGTKCPAEKRSLLDKKCPTEKRTLWDTKCCNLTTPFHLKSFLVLQLMRKVIVCVIFRVNSFYPVFCCIEC